MRPSFCTTLLVLCLLRSLRLLLYSRYYHNCNMYHHFRCFFCFFVHWFHVVRGRTQSLNVCSTDCFLFLHSCATIPPYCCHTIVFVACASSPFYRARVCAVSLSIDVVIIPSPHPVLSNRLFARPVVYPVLYRGFVCLVREKTWQRSLLLLALSDASYGLDTEVITQSWQRR